MRKRPSGFLADDKIPHDSEIFRYITELHDYLWCFVRTAIPSASGNLNDYVDIALKETQRRLQPASRTEEGKNGDGKV